MVEYKGYEIGIRKLTPVEVWRLQGLSRKVDGVWDDSLFNKAASVCSNTQLYKQAGNGITVDVVSAIARNLYEPDEETAPEIDLIEFFGGIGCQRLGFERAGFKVHSAMYCDIDKYAVKSYNAMFGESHEPTDITTVHGSDLPVRDDMDCVLFYSFPCQDISTAGKKNGYSKGSNTRSGLLWEVERILQERFDSGLPMPDFLIMENVTQVRNKKNESDWLSWLSFLESIGYHNTVANLNSCDYGIPQSRTRTFMISSIGGIDWYKWPDPIELETTMEDFLDADVDDKWFVNAEKSDKLVNQLIERGELDAYL